VRSLWPVSNQLLGLVA